jgi:hypothetical protein
VGRWARGHVGWCDGCMSVWACGCMDVWACGRGACGNCGGVGRVERACGRGCVGLVWHRVHTFEDGDIISMHQAG